MKRRDYRGRPDRPMSVKMERSKCRFFLEGRCAKVLFFSSIITDVRALIVPLVIISNHKRSKNSVNFMLADLVGKVLGVLSCMASSPANFFT